MTLNSSFMPGWYAVLPAHFLKKQKPLGITRFGLDFVLWRSKEGVAHCFLDRCPHRGAKLSIGKIKNNCIECPYHGFRFNVVGTCELAPEFDKPLPGLNLKKYPVKESTGMIWMLYGKQGKEFNFPELYQLHQSFCTAYCETYKIWDSHITYCIENQLDYTHLPSVHKNTIGRQFKYPKDPSFFLNKRKISIGFHGKNPVLDFYFPNAWVLHVSKKMKLLVYFAPVDDKKTILYLRNYSSILKFNVTRLTLAPIFNKLSRIILRQDERIVSSQGRLPSYAAMHDLLMTNDRAIKYFRQCWSDNVSTNL